LLITGFLDEALEFLGLILPSLASLLRSNLQRDGKELILVSVNVRT
jgi:hypothetical protein